MTHEMILFLTVVAVTVFLFVVEWVRVDVVALLAMVSLAWLGLVTPAQAFSGLASNAVVAVIAVIILGHGIDRTGVMSHLARPVIRVAGKSPRRLVALVSATVGLVSAFMQNIGAAALFLPAVTRIARRLGLAPSRLLMPMGFAAILGGTITMVASGPLILLNDLLRQSALPAYGLFDVTPIGLALLAGGILYFLLLGPVLLPHRVEEHKERDPQALLVDDLGLSRTIHCARIPEGSSLVGKTIEETAPWRDFHINVLVLRDGKERLYAPWRHTRLAAGHELALLGERENVKRYAAQGLELCNTRDPMREELESGESGGFAELVVRPRAEIVGRSLRQIALRQRFGVEPVLLLSGDEPAHHDFSDHPLRAGDVLVVHGLWDRLRALGDDGSYVLLTPILAAQADPDKALRAVLCFLGAIGLAVAGFPLAVSLLSGALAMVLLRVTSMDAAYRAVDWRTVFLLAGLIPLGTAMETSGTAAWIAAKATTLLSGAEPLLLLSVVALMATLFSLFMSNVAATVLLVPLVAELGVSAGVSPRALGLLVAICASNSFILPTHQVNALLMSPGGYRNADYLRAGSGMTLLFIAITVCLIYLFYL